MKITIPDRRKVNGKQVTNLYAGGSNGYDGYAYINVLGQVTIVSNALAAREVSFGMGSDIPIVSRPVIEFTIENINGDEFVFYVRNVDGIARKVKVSNLGVVYLDLYTNVSKVIGGTVIYASDNSYAVGGGMYVKLFENGAVDAILVGKFLQYIYPTPSGSKVLKIVAGYTLTRDNELFMGENLIATNVYDIGYFTQGISAPLDIGKIGNDDLSVKNIVAQILESNNIDYSFYQGYLSFIASKTHPTCEWAGIHETNTTTKSVGACVTQVPANGSKNKSGVLVSKNDGKIYQIVNGILIEQIRVDDDAVGFEALYKKNDEGKFVLFPQRGMDVPSYFDVSEVGLASSIIFQ